MIPCNDSVAACKGWGVFNFFFGVVAHLEVVIPGQTNEFELAVSSHIVISVVAVAFINITNQACKMLEQKRKYN